MTKEHRGIPQTYPYNGTTPRPYPSTPGVPIANGSLARVASLMSGAWDVKGSVGSGV